MTEDLRGGDFQMHSSTAVQQSPLDVSFQGTEYGVGNADTTACSDSEASMLANTVIVLEPIAVSADLVVPSVNDDDPSEYFS